MNKPQKIYWSLRNIFQAFYLQHFQKENSGLLTSRENNKDQPYLGINAVKPKHESLSLMHNPDWVFDQEFLNICVFAGGVMGLSHQEKKRFSIKFAVKLAKKLGYISGNGFSFQKAILKIATKYGLLPYEDMPDEINESWPEYSKYDITQSDLDLAKKYKFPPFKRLTGIGEVITAIEEGLWIHTANVWYSDMNMPDPPDYYLKTKGYKIGGHAWGSGGYRRQGESLMDNKILNSFGKKWADKGMARIEDLFSDNQYPVYVVGKLKGNPEIQQLIKDHKKYLVRSDANGEWYKITENGLKYIPTIPEIAQDLKGYLQQSPETINEMIEFMTKKGMIKWATEEYYNKLR